MDRFLWICLGGAAGTGARYLVTDWAQRWLGSGLPWGTFAVNVLGSFLVGVLMQTGLAMESISPTMRMALTTGVMGGFTTYSAFSYETVRMMDEDAWLLAFLNIGATTVTCLLACYMGIVAARMIVGG
ncbi:MAG TPA: fluoride efflux transporter CrcB [Planctomycetota bacterium]